MRSSVGCGLAPREGMRGVAGASSAASKATTSRRSLVVMCVATPSKPPTSRQAKRSKVEIIKENSDYLRHPLMQELVNEHPYISEEAVQLMKFHGSYMQDDREKRTFGAGKAYCFMMRTRQPAGAVTNQLYLAMDDLADQVPSATLPTSSQDTERLFFLVITALLA
jgi:sulfite reductase (ferredoxin)